MEEPGATWERLLAKAPAGSIDDFARKGTNAALLTYKQSARVQLADIYVRQGDNVSKSLVGSLMAAEPGTDMTVGFYHPDLSENWDYDTPAKGMFVGRKGVGWVEHFRYDPYSFDKWNFEERFKKSEGLVMGHITHYHVPESIKAHTIRENACGEVTYEAKLLPFDQLHAELVSGRVVPFRIRLCAYTQEARFSFSVDLVNNCLVRDFRASKLPPKGRLFRKPIDCLAFDRIYAAERLPVHVANAFMLIFEREGTTVYDLSHVVGLNEASARNTLQALASRGLARKEGAAPRENFFADMENIHKMAESR